MSSDVAYSHRKKNVFNFTVVNLACCVSLPRHIDEGRHLSLGYESIFTHATSS